LRCTRARCSPGSACCWCVVRVLWHDCTCVRACAGVLLVGGVARS
jgi:hypothetical protein